jgi:tetratricopeptide (TPR) repeat protein
MSSRAEYDRAFDFYRRGDLAQAERACGAILQTDPGCAEAAHLLGLMSLQRGEPRKAEQQISYAIKLNPRSALAHNNHALALKELGRQKDALTSFERAISLKPDFIEAHVNRGATLHELRRYGEAIASYDRAIALRPEFAGAHSNRASALKELGRLDEALKGYGTAIALKPDFAEAFYNRGLVLRDLRLLEAALESIEQAISLGLKDAEAFCDRGCLLREAGRFDEALRSFDASLALNPDCFNAFNNRGLALQGLERLDEALASLDHAIALKPDSAEAHNNRGGVLLDLGRVEEAIDSFSRAIELRPDYAEALSNRAQCNLSLGLMGDGWADYQHRWRARDFALTCRSGVDPADLLVRPERRTLRDANVLVIAEQGVGEEIMFSSMIPDLVAEARNVALECDPRLATLFARSFGGVTVIERTTPRAWHAGDYDCIVPGASLGGVYRNALTEFPQRRRYLTAHGAIAAQWNKRLSHLQSGMKVGISWRGGTALTHKTRRSIALDQWGPILRQPGIDFVSLQYGDAKSEIENAEAIFDRTITRFEPSEIDDFDQLAGLVSALDLVITVQTAVVHLSGAIGHPCWAMVPRAPEWRYGTRGTSMPWYQSVDLYRQCSRGNWRDTVESVAEDLSALTNRRLP